MASDARLLKERSDDMDPPRIEPYETLQPLFLHPDLASFAVRDRETGAPATVWLSEQSLPVPPAAPSHPHVLQVYSHGMRDGYEYVVTEPVHETLRTILTREGMLSSQRAIGVAVGVARGLSQLLAADIPVARVGVADVAVGPDGTPKVISFSLPAVETSSEDAGLLSSLGGLYYEMLTGRRPRPDDPLAAASTEILRGLLRSSLARERIGQVPEPEALPALPPPPEPRPGLPSLMTILRWSGAMAAVAIVAIVLGVQASMRPLLVDGPSPSPPVASPPAVASLPPRPAFPAAVTIQPRITERPRSASRPERRVAGRAVAQGEVANVPASRRVSPASAQVRQRVASRIARAPVLRKPLGRRVSAAVPSGPVPGVTAAVPRVSGWRPRERRVRPMGRATLARMRAFTLARLPSVVEPRERVLAEPPSEYRDVERRPRRGRVTRADDAGVPSVRLKIVLDADGRPETALVVRSSGDPRRDQAAVRAAREMRFDPPRSQGDESGPRRGGVAYATLAVPSAHFPRLAHPVSEIP